MGHPQVRVGVPLTAYAATRKWRAEAPVGWIGEVPGFGRFGLRGPDKVRSEWDLVYLELNVKRM